MGSAIFLQQYSTLCLSVKRPHEPGQLYLRRPKLTALLHHIELSQHPPAGNSIRY